MRSPFVSQRDIAILLCSLAKAIALAIARGAVTVDAARRATYSISATTSPTATAKNDATSAVGVALPGTERTVVVAVGLAARSRRARKLTAVEWGGRGRIGWGGIGRGWVGRR